LVWKHRTRVSSRSRRIGGSLGPEYQSHDTHDWLQDCFRQRPYYLEDTVIAKSERRMLTERTVTREAIRLQPHDVVVLNGSVHGDRTLNLNAIADLMRCIADDNGKWPHFVYMATGTQHFPTPSGAFEKSCSNRKRMRVQQKAHGMFNSEKNSACCHPSCSFWGKTSWIYSTSRVTCTWGTGIVRIGSCRGFQTFWRLRLCGTCKRFE
jgi:hypothetical protein